MTDLHLIEGPAGSGKSQLARDMLDAGEVDLLADTTALWAAVGSYERGADGKYPVREDNDPALRVALYLQATAAAFALREGYNVAVTTSQRDQGSRWQEIADANQARFQVRTVDPGEGVVRQRLAEPDGTLSESCKKAVRRWYKR